MFQICACWICQIYGFVFQILDPKEYHPIAFDHLTGKIKICYLYSHSHDLPRPVLEELYQLQHPIRLLPCHVSVQFDLSCVQNRPIYHQRNHALLQYQESSTKLSKNWVIFELSGGWHESKSFNTYKGQDKASLRQGFARGHFDPLAIKRQLGLFSQR